MFFHFFIIDEHLTAFYNENNSKNNDRYDNYTLKAFLNNSACAAHQLHNIVLKGKDQGRNTRNEHEYHREIQHPVRLVGLSQIYRNGKECRYGNQLVTGAEQRPYILIACQAQYEAEESGNNGSHIHIAEHVLLFPVSGEQLLEHETSQSRTGIQ